MLKIDPSKQIRKLLDAIRTDFPRRKAAAESVLRQRYGLDDTIELTISPPEKFRYLPTFDPNRRRQPTPMLRARFDSASTIKQGLDLWLRPAEMERWMKKRAVRAYHQALRENYEGSAPNLFSNQDLTLLIVTQGVPENLTYLVWSGKEEPEVWSYVGMETYKFKNLLGYLTWCLNRD